jgi:hypothetical protein
VRILLISTYELGRQPVHLASPAAALSRAGHDVSTLDLAVESLTAEHFGEVDAVAISVPMHTAMRLAVSAATLIRDMRPDLPIAFYGLYAGVGRADILGIAADRLIVGEYEPALVSWVEDMSDGLTSETGHTRFHLPARSTLPPLSSYARLEWEGETRIVGAVEASHGCRHRCRHCPIPVVYDGRWRAVRQEVVLGDIAAQAAAGAQHITFGDPDFLNAPRHSMSILEEAHAAHPDLTFDVTVKVSHLLQHRRLVTDMARSGVLFIVSAFETVDGPTLEILAKNHTVADMAAATDLVRAAGVHIRPTWLPFFPWTSVADVAAIADFLDAFGLWEATDPVQLSIKLLIPEGSLLENHPAVVPHLERYRPEALTWGWRFASTEVDALHRSLGKIAEEASDCRADAIDTLTEMSAAIDNAAGRKTRPLSPGPKAPRLTESWFCCAEPTANQAVAISAPAITVPL